MHFILDLPPATTSFEDIQEIPSNPRKPNKNVSFRKKIPYHVTSQEGRDMIAVSDVKKKEKQVKQLEKKACMDAAYERKKKCDVMRRKAEREGDPMRPRKSTLEAREKVFGKSTGTGAGTGTGTGTGRTAPKRKCVERKTTKRKPNALPREPKLGRP